MIKNITKESSTKIQDLEDHIIEIERNHIEDTKSIIKENESFRDLIGILQNIMWQAARKDNIQVIKDYFNNQGTKMGIRRLNG